MGKVHWWCEQDAWGYRLYAEAKINGRWSGACRRISVDQWRTIRDRTAYLKFAIEYLQHQLYRMAQ